MTLTAESLRLYNDKEVRQGRTFAQWAEATVLSREKHNGVVKPGGEIEATLKWVDDYLSGKFGKVCPLDMAQMQDVLELADFTSPDFRADGTWGGQSQAALFSARHEGHTLFKEMQDINPVNDWSSGKR